MNKLTQSKNFVKREFRLTESKLFHNYYKFGNGNEVDIPFENIDGEKVSHKKSNNLLLLIAGLIYIISISLFVSWNRGGDVEEFAWIFWAVIASSFVAGYYFTREDYWKIKLSNNQYIYFHKNVPSRAETDNFIASLIESRNSFLVGTYGQIDEHLEYQNQLQNFRWLRSVGAITQEEFDAKYTQLKRTIKAEKKDIGFSK